MEGLCRKAPEPATRAFTAAKIVMCASWAKSCWMRWSSPCTETIMQRWKPMSPLRMNAND
eukprot:2831147-Ditylum_brightwellii.AAC.1